MITIQVLDEFDSGELADKSDVIWSALATTKEEPQTGFARKFLVYHEVTTPNVFLLIGPMYNKDKPAPYFHEQMEEEVSDLFKSPSIALSGGGLITLIKTGSGCSAQFGDRSRIKGIWSPVLLLHRQAIATWLNMNCEFTWSDFAYPAKK